MMSSRMKSKIKGFTLIEVMISIAILVIGLVGIILVIPMAQRVAGRSAFATRAAIFASEKTEELKAKGYDELISNPTWNGSSGDFDWEATISPVTGSDFEALETIPGDFFIKIVMEVSYRAQGSERKDTYTTFYSEL
jgi:prepilin-type N-terminal cleavage/methylation domain-containing protein